METTINYDDTSIDIQAHQPSGEFFVNQYASLWRGDQCVGATIIASISADGEHFDRDDWLDKAEMLLINAGDEAIDNAAWANEQEWQQIKSSV